MKTGAILSDDRDYRYLLWREWDETLPKLMFVGLNPSTADEKTDDPTIKRCIEFARSWGYGGFYMTNLFAYRSTSPDELKKVDDPIGQDNDKFIKEYANLSQEIVACWGNHGAYMGRSEQVKSLLLDKLSYLELNKTGQPKHPLYIKSNAKPQKYKQIKFL